MDEQSDYVDAIAQDSLTTMSFKQPTSMRLCGVAVFPVG